MTTATKRRGPDAANVEAPRKNKDANPYSNSINDLRGFALVGGNGANRKAPAVKGWPTGPLRPIRPGEWMGVPTGRNQITVVDIDGRAGIASFKALLIEHTGHTKMPRTLTVSTPSGGCHLVFQLVPGTGSPVGWLPSVDLRGVSHEGKQSYIVSPLTPGYHVLRDAGIQPMPAWLVDLMPTRKIVTPSTPALNPEPKKHSADGLVHAMRNAAEGQRNATLHWAACRAYEMGRPAKARRTVNYLADAARDKGLPAWEIDRAIRNAREEVMGNGG